MTTIDKKRDDAGERRTRTTSIEQERRAQCRGVSMRALMVLRSGKMPRCRR